jgi:hypothetical protein
MSKLSKVPISRMAGATHLGYASWMGCLLGCLAAAMPMAHYGWSFTIGYVAVGLIYLGVIWAKPAFLSKVSFFAPLFEAGVKGHLIALAARFPHFCVLVLGNWVSYFFFHVDIPFGAALLYLPIVLIVSTLPLTPQGFGTRDALSATFFLAYAPGASDPERVSALAACTLSWGLAATFITLIIGLVFDRFVQRRLARASASST